MASQPNVEAAPFVPRLDDPTPFPEAERVIYAKNPLELVICQFRFPAILKISSEPPAEFQESLRKGYPLFREVPPLDLGTGLPAELANILGKLLPNPSSRAYEFSSEDGTWQFTLTQDSLALACKSYRRWEDFKESLLSALDPLQKIY
ncbi:MAG TPA: TIGR04255 family protein, partial [Candidatus Solibacter sp.]|nr:TIGR04255 family protein [Candidatus Solibacter sp.]